MEGFKWELPSPVSWKADQAALARVMAENQSVKLPAGPDAPYMVPRPALTAAELEWT
jgi:hypothetical protein